MDQQSAFHPCTLHEAQIRLASRLMVRSIPYRGSSGCRAFPERPLQHSMRRRCGVYLTETERLCGTLSVVGSSKRSVKEPRTGASLCTSGGRTEDTGGKLSELSIQAGIVRAPARLGHYQPSSFQPTKRLYEGGIPGLEPLYST